MLPDRSDDLLAELLRDGYRALLRMVCDQQRALADLRDRLERLECRLAGDPQVDRFAPPLPADDEVGDDA